MSPGAGHRGAPDDQGEKLPHNSIAILLVLQY